MKKILAFLILGTLCTSIFAQSGYVQTIRGKIIDKATQTPLIGANVILINSNPPVGSSTDENGNYRIPEVKVGRVGLQVSYMGYNPVTLTNLMLNSAKELVINIELEEQVIQSQEVVVKAFKDKGEVVNKMASVSARTFSVEQTERYAGSRGDVARMAMNFAGISGANDSRNDIIIRGNSPSGVLWQLEDVEIGNPNHFAFQGTTGGPVGMLNNNTLSTSDFMTGAFPAQYGNALSGVFDLKMRNGNNEKYEFLGQMGFNGLEFGSEGPFSKAHKGSFLVNYRLSTLQIMDMLGINMGTGGGIPFYQDLSFKIHLPIKNGIIDVYGLFGASKISMLDSKQKEDDMYTNNGQDLYNGANLSVAGVAFTHYLSDKSYLKIILSGTNQNLWTNIDTLDIDKHPKRIMTSKHIENRITLNAFVNHKFNSRITTKYGVSVNRIGFNMSTDWWNADSARWEKPYDTKLELRNGINRVNLYNQWVYKFNETLSLHPGLQVQYLDKTNEISVEPRLALTYKITDFQKINFGYGLHSQSPNIIVLYYQGIDGFGNSYMSNQNLKFTKAHHFIAGYDILLAENLRLKIEGYYQQLFNMPISDSSSSYSMINTGSDYGINVEDSMVNKGKAHNYGLELTLEKYFANNYYYLFTTSLYESKYKGSDGIERNTAFNGNYVFNLLVGKEIAIGTKRTLSFDIKTTFAGGKRKTPIDMVASQNGSKFETKYDETRAYSEQFSPYFKLDFKIALRKNGKRVSQEWQIYVENITNHKNPLMETYDKSSQQIKTNYQLGIFPMVNYRIYF